MEKEREGERNGPPFVADISVLPEGRGGKICPNPFACPNPPTLIKPKPTQLLIRLNGHQPN